MRTVLSIGLFLGSTLLLVFTLMHRVERGVSYYKDGTLKHKVILKDGRPEGFGITYYPSGKILSKTFWSNGKKHGPSIHYYEDGSVRQESEFVSGVCRFATDYDKKGYKNQVTIFDSLGRIIDYFRFKPNGQRDLSAQSKRVLFIPFKDTVSKKEEYVAEIRLGNRQFSRIEVIIGSLNDPEMPLKGSALPMKDSLTAFVRVTPDSVGINILTGIVVERASYWDSLFVVPFEHRYVVID